MRLKPWILLFAMLGCLAGTISAQKIIYSETDKDDNLKLNFEIIGKIGNYYQIYKNVRNRNYIVLYDQNMKQVDKVEQDYMPDDRLINVDFYPYDDFSYLIYQYQRKSVVYCVGVKIDARGKTIAEPVELDSSHIGFTANNKIYTTLSSEDKSKIIVFKINSRNRNKFIISTQLYNDKLELLKKSRLTMPMDERNYLEEFQLDNAGNLVFTKFYRNNNDNINHAALVIKHAAADSFAVRDLNFEGIYLDRLFIKVDNFNHRYFLTSFYYKERRGNIDGFYFFVWDKDAAKVARENRLTFSDDLRNEARGKNSLRSTFNDFFIRNIIINKNGGFIIGTESYYTTSRHNNWNRWNYLYGNPYFSSFDNYYYSPYFGSYNRWLWRNRHGSSQAVRHHADNIVILAFDNTGSLEWSNVIRKEQFNDDSDNTISFQLLNTGGELHFLFNVLERRALLLNDFVLDPDGSINRNPTLKNLDKGYEFMPKYGKQIGARQAIIPCIYRNYISFAKVDFNKESNNPR